MGASRSEAIAALRQLPAELQQFVREELSANESLVWIGQPDHRL